MHPKEYEVRRLRIGQDAMRDPSVGVEIAAGKGQQQRNRQDLLAARWRIEPA
jgi:hypothetical protein